VLDKNLRILFYSISRIRVEQCEDSEDEDDSMGAEPEKAESVDEYSEHNSPNESYEQELDESEDAVPTDLMGELTAPLSAQEYAALKQACSKPCVQQQGDCSFQRDQLVLQSHDLQGLIRTSWLKGDVVDAAMRDLNSTQSTVLGINTAWTERAIEFSPDELDRWNVTQELKRAVLPSLLGQTQQPTECRYLAFPVHREAHWVLAILDLQLKQFTHMDSWQRGGTIEAARKELDALQNLFDHLAGDARITWQPHVCVPALAQQYDVADTRPLELRDPAGDCGVFLIAWAFAMTGTNLIAVDQRNMGSIRARLALRLLARRASEP
jgi:Ulp1 family protease